MEIIQISTPSSKERLSLKTQLEIEFLLPFNGSKKVLEKIPAMMNHEKVLFNEMAVYTDKSYTDTSS